MATELNVKINNGIIQKANQDKNGNDIIDTYFSKSGGQVAGGIKRNINDSMLELCGGRNYLEGAYLQLYGDSITSEERNLGMFALCAGTRKKNNGVSELRGYCNGDLVWTTAQGQFRDLASSAITSKSLDMNGYVRYASRLLIQWGFTSLGKDPSKEINYNVSFSSATNLCIAMANEFANNPILTVHSMTKSSFIVKSSEECQYVNWIAIGY